MDHFHSSGPSLLKSQVGDVRLNYFNPDDPSPRVPLSVLSGHSPLISVRTGVSITSSIS